MYTAKLSLSSENVDDVLAVASFLQMQDIITACHALKSLAEPATSPGENTVASAAEGKRLAGCPEQAALDAVLPLTLFPLSGPPFPSPALPAPWSARRKSQEGLQRDPPVCLPVFPTFYPLALCSAAPESWGPAWPRPLHTGVLLQSLPSRALPLQRTPSRP